MAELSIEPVMMMMVLLLFVVLLVFVVLLLFVVWVAGAAFAMACATLPGAPQRSVRSSQDAQS